MMMSLCYPHAAKSTGAYRSPSGGSLRVNGAFGIYSTANPLFLDDYSIFGSTLRITLHCQRMNLLNSNNNPRHCPENVLSSQNHSSEWFFYAQFKGVTHAINQPLWPYKPDTP